MELDMMNASRSRLWACSLALLMLAAAVLWPPRVDAGPPQLVPLLPTGHSTSADAVALSSDGKYVVTGSFDGAVILWDAAGAIPLQTFAGPPTTSGQVISLGVSGDAKYVVARWEYGPTVL